MLLLCYAALLKLLINFTYYAKYYAHVKDMYLGIQLGIGLLCWHKYWNNIGTQSNEQNASLLLT